jgi:HEAT repeat protein
LSQQTVAITSLRKIGPKASPAVPQLIRGLNGEVIETRYQSARTLEVIGTNAVSAIPILKARLNDASVLVRSASLRALEAITGAP